MGLNFRKSIKIAPGVKLNIGKKSVGVSAGVKGAHISMNSSGRKTATISAPGTGLSYTANLNKKKSSRSKKSSEAEKSKVNGVLVAVIVVLIAVIAVGVYAYQNGLL